MALMRFQQGGTLLVVCVNIVWLLSSARSPERRRVLLFIVWRGCDAATLQQCAAARIGEITVFVTYVSSAAGT